MSSTRTTSTSSSSSRQGLIRHSSSISEQCSCPAATHEKAHKPAHVTLRRTNRVRHIHKAQPFEHFVEALESDGCVVVQDFVSPLLSRHVHDADAANLERQVDEGQAQITRLDDDSLVRESLLSDSLFQTLVLHFLGLETISWKDQNVTLKGTKPRVSSSCTRDLNSSPIDVPSLHRADSVHHTRHAATPKYEYQSRRETNLGIVVPELDSLSGFIPIKTIPGSHLWDDQKPDLSRGVKETELRAGEALILLGSLYHEVSVSDVPNHIRPEASRTRSGTVNQRLMHEIWMCSGIYRPAHEIESDEDDP